MTQDSYVDHDCLVEVILEHEKAVAPSKAHASDAGFDLSSVEEVWIQPGARVLVDTGIKLSIPEGWEGQVRPRSGNAIKRGLTVLNTPGTIDAGYLNNVKVILFNASNMPIHVLVGDKIAQLVYARVPVVLHCKVKAFSKTSDRGTQGFGSTGTVGG